MDDLKKGYREGETETKEAWRNRDGTDVKDAIGNAGDEIRKNLGNLGDDAKKAERKTDRNPDVDTTDTTDTSRTY